MKAVYAQSGWLTFLKFIVLGFAYAVCGLVMLLAVTLFSAVAP